MPSYLAVHPEVGSMFGLIAFDITYAFRTFRTDKQHWKLFTHLALLLALGILNLQMGTVVLKMKYVEVKTNFPITYDRHDLPKFPKK